MKKKTKPKIKRQIVESFKLHDITDDKWGADHIGEIEWKDGKDTPQTAMINHMVSTLLSSPIEALRKLPDGKYPVTVNYDYEGEDDARRYRSITIHIVPHMEAMGDGIYHVYDKDYKKKRDELDAKRAKMQEEVSDAYRTVKEEIEHEILQLEDEYSD
jgi:hypothetical protein